MQSDPGLYLSLEYSMSVKLLTEQHLELLSLIVGCTGSTESTLVKRHYCWNYYESSLHILKSHFMAN